MTDEARVFLHDLKFYEGEKPRPMEVDFYLFGELDTSLAGATMVCKFWIDNIAKPDLSMQNNNNGTAMVIFPTGSSAFVVTVGQTKSTLRFDVEITQGSNSWVGASFLCNLFKR